MKEIKTCVLRALLEYDAAKEVDNPEMVGESYDKIGYTYTSMGVGRYLLKGYSGRLYITSRSADKHAF